MQTVKTKVSQVFIEVVSVFFVMVILFVLVPIRFLNKVADSLFGK